MESQIQQVAELVRFLEIETYVHATESLDKVLDAIERNMLQGENLPIVLELLWGLYGNPIIRIHIFTDNESIAERIFLNTVCKLKNLDKLLSTLELRLDKAGNLYIRVNKQELILDRVVLDDESDDIVRIKVRVNRRLIKEKILAKAIEDRCLKCYEDEQRRSTKT